MPKAGRLKTSTSSGERGEPSAELTAFQAFARWPRTTPLGKPVVPEV